MTKPDFQKKIIWLKFGQIGPKSAQIPGFGKLFKFASLNFSDFAYFSRQTWYLTDNGGLVAKKNFRAKFGPNLDLSPNYFCLQIHFLDCYSSIFIRFVYYDRQQGYPGDFGDFIALKNF